MAIVFYGWWIALSCFFIALYVGGILFYGFTAFFEPIAEEFGWSYTQVSIAFSLRGLEMGILAPITGFLVDRFGPRRLVLSGAVIVGSALILLSFTQSLFMFYATFILLAFGTSGCASTVLMTAMAHWFKRNVGKAMGFVACGFGAGGVLIPLVVWLTDLYQWRTTLVILGLAMWALGIPLSFVIRHRPEQSGYLPDGDISTKPDAGQESESTGEETDFKKALKQRSLWTIGIADAIRIMIALAVITHIMPYLSSIGMSRAGAAWIATSVPLLSIIGRFGFGWLGDVFDKRHVLAAAYCLFGLGTFALSYVHVKWLVFLFLLLFPPALGGCVVLRGAIVRDYFGRAFFGRLLGIIIGITAVGGVIGPSITGWSYDKLGAYHPAWFSFAAVSVIPVVLALRLRAPRRINHGSLH